MTTPPAIALVTTIKERCRVCYTCVRECPAKAIRIANGQAEVVVGRCIGCGNCVRVCSQKAKQVFSSIETVRQLLASGRRVSACVAPSFPAEFSETDDAKLVGMVRALGFTLVNEVAFGADLVAGQYQQLLKENGIQRLIATTCPAIVEYVCRYHPDLTPFLAPVVSPMLATARALKYLHGEDLKIVFIGPCIAKKAEMDPRRDTPEVDAVLTFSELRQLLAEENITSGNVAPGDFDPPHSGSGALFPVSRGMLQAARISDDLLPGNVLAADGRSDFVEAIKEFESGDLNVRLLEVLCCSGCIMGPGISSPLPLFSRRSRVIQYVRRRLKKLDVSLWQETVSRFAELDLSRRFTVADQRIPGPSAEEVRTILNRMGKFEAKDELNCGACGYDTCREHAIAIYNESAESEMCLPYTIDQLRKTLGELAASNNQLADVQAALVQSEKLASMGQLAAGIAHEINNPLGIVLMYAHLMLDECTDDQGMRDDLKMIVEQTDRCKKIVAGLLNFARQNKVNRQPADIVELVGHVLKTLPPPDGILVQTVHETANLVAELDPDQITQVLNNLLTNAYEAMPGGGTMTVHTANIGADMVAIRVTDTGSGISQENLSKIFEPFFTTKKMGKGTGLGLAVAYGIIKMHRGDIRLASNADPAAGNTGTTFSITLPRRGRW